VPFVSLVVSLLMLRFDLPLTDTSLLLHPRFGDRAAIVQVFLLLLCIAPVVLVGWLYRYELRMVRPTMARVLLALRLLVVLMLVVVVAFQPVAARTISETLPGRVIVGLDRSDSMSVTDPQRSVLEKLRLARALRLVHDICPDSKLDAWIKQVEKTGSVDLPIGGQTDDSLRRTLDQVCQRVDGVSRGQVARAVLGNQSGGLLSAIDRQHKLELLGFAGTGSEIDPAKLDKLPPLGDPGATTDLRVPLARGLEGGATNKTLAVVVLTDGQHNDPASPVDKAVELGQQGIPVFAVAIGAKTPPTDIVVTAIQAPATVFKGSDANVEAHVEVRGLTARSIEIELQRKGQEPLVEKIEHDGTDRGYTVKFSPKMEEVGTQIVTVHARPAPEETRTENNSRPAAINVADDKAHVLLVDGEGRWEFHYLLSALVRDRGMEVQSVLFRQPRVDRIDEAELRQIGHPAQSLPTDPDAMAKYDCIILGDVTPEELPPADRARLEKFVGERGGTLVLLAGKRAMPLSYLTDTAPDDPMRKLLPIEAAGPIDAPSGFPVSLTTEGKLSTFLRMEPTTEESESRWAKLPRQLWGLIGRAKPAATVLATYRPEEEDGAARPMADPGTWAKEHALIARQSYGFGRVLYVGLDSTWRWRFRVGDTYHHRFWGQVIRWAAADTPLLTGNEFVRFGPRKPIIEQGAEVEIGVRFSEQATRLAPAAPAAVRLLRVKDGQADEPVGQVNLQRLEARPKELQAKVRDLPAGHYVAELVIPDLGDQLLDAPGENGKRLPLRAPFTVSGRPSTEMLDVATNLPLLEEIAAKSGGKVFTAENASELAELLAQKTAVHEFRTDTKLWEAWPTLVVFLGLLTLEWLARKWAGLP
jgi:hypothetical protein